jgi:hypothetical protein
MSLRKNQWQAMGEAIVDYLDNDYPLAVKRQEISAHYQKELTVFRQLLTERIKKPSCVSGEYASPRRYYWPRSLETPLKSPCNNCQPTSCARRRRMAIGTWIPTSCWSSLGRMVRSGKLPVDATSDSGRISLSYSRAEIADTLYDDLADFSGELGQSDYRLVACHQPTAADLQRYPELRNEGAYLLFP